MKKVAFIGTSCSGKTTTTLRLAHQLKMMGILCEALTSTDRRHTYRSSDLERSEDAQSFIILQQAATEAMWGSRGDTDVLVCDRSVVDFYAYFDHSFASSRKKDAIESFVRGWSLTYDALYYLAPLPYVDDGKRPSDSFRMDVDSRLRAMLVDYPFVRVGSTFDEVLRDTVELVGSQEDRRRMRGDGS